MFVHMRTRSEVYGIILYFCTDFKIFYQYKNLQKKVYERTKFSKVEKQHCLMIEKSVGQI